ncbi:methionine aminopeptidase [Allobranchiibius huperziae]|uniref:Methionine aminopeptidase n=1 Tax=Allobranchiibius huperziae TaxID=1874116 RepID=A0A853DCS9_9MICO|nr:methionine aminopeptidase [Allobranchiibius huperziae]NYJ74377.1 hypothetical protein [Allobranchiibius huperziae]
MTYWYNVDSGQVEDDEHKSAADHLMGPYQSRDDAANALAKARENTEKWDAEDRDWNSKGSSD